MPKQPTQSTQPTPSQILLLCLNPTCPTPKDRCLDSQTIRSHPSQCSRYYYSVDTVTSMHWTHIPDYPADPVGVEVRRRIMGDGKEGKEGEKGEKGKEGCFRRIVGEYREKLGRILDWFVVKFEESCSATQLEDIYKSTYSLQKISEYLVQSCNPTFISKTLTSTLSNPNYTILSQTNQNYTKIIETLQHLSSGLKSQLKQLLQTLTFKKEKERERERGDRGSYRVEEGVLKPKIQYGLVKSKFVGSLGIQCRDGRIWFPRLGGDVVSFLPWIYGDRGFTAGVHQLRLTSLKFPTVPNAGLCVLQEHDIDTYPYHYFKSLFNKQSKGFTLAQSDPDQPPTTTTTPTLTPTIPKTTPKKSSPYSQIQYTIGQTSEIILRLELTTKPRAIIRDVGRTSVYVCELVEGRKYRMGVYGSGWVVSINQLW